VEFPLPSQAVESVMDELRAARGSEETYTVVTNAESVTSEHIDEMERRYVTGTEEDDSIATEEIRATALGMTPSPRTYYSMTLLSALVATAGLLVDSAAVVVGSMVIAPLVGSAMTASVGTVLDDRRMVVQGFKTQLLGLGLAVLGATAFSVALRSAAFLPPALDVTTTRQIAQRISPGLLSVVVGLCAGAAGAFGLATGVPVALVGVMIAAALIPAAAAVGIGLAWGIPAVALGAVLLLVMNAIAIHVAGAGVLWYLGYRPETWARESRWRPSPGQAGVLAVTVLVLGAVFVGAAALVSTQVAFEQEVNGAVGDVLEEPRYDDLELVAVSAEFRAESPLTVTPAGERQVTVTLARPADREYRELGRAVHERIAADTGREVTVVLEFVDQQRYPPTT
jgi:uncharacterized hydrophobic protein (TIGR00341 family)